MLIIKPFYEIEVMPGYFEWVVPHIERAIRTCYRSEDKICEGSAEKLISRILDSKHLSTVEHGGFTVRFIVDRGVSHELVRHRLASYSQESTRYCNYNKDKFGNEITVIRPCWFKEDLELVQSKMDPSSMEYIWVNSMNYTESMYFSLLKSENNPNGWTPQQARTVLPNSLKTEVVMSANFREWREVLQQRTSNAAHPQIREVCRPLLDELKTLVPVIFDDIN